MENLQFNRRKYQKELLIDACNEQELDIVADTLVLNFYTILLLKEASGTYRLDAEEIPLQAGTILFVRPGQVSRVDRSKFGKCYLLFFESEFLDEFFQDRHFIYQFGYFHNQQTPSFLHLTEPAEFDQFYSTAHEIWAEIKQLSQDSHHILRSLIYYLLVKLHRTYSQHHGTARDTMTDPWILGFLRLLDKHPRENLSVEACARQLGISRVHLNHLCQAYFSKTAHQLIREKRITEIKKSILFSQQDLAEIAYDFQFSAPSHFTRFFSQMTGLTPQAFREEFSKW